MGACPRRTTARRSAGTGPKSPARASSELTPKRQADLVVALRPCLASDARPPSTASEGPTATGGLAARLRASCVRESDRFSKTAVSETLCEAVGDTDPQRSISQRNQRHSRVRRTLRRRRIGYGGVLDRRPERLGATRRAERGGLQVGGQCSDGMLRTVRSRCVVKGR
jgi:hypothetical protein